MKVNETSTGNNSEKTAIYDDYRPDIFAGGFLV